MTLPAAALFDLDGTLVDRESMMERAIVSVLAAAGVPLEAHESGIGVGRSWVDVHADLAIEARTGWDVATLVGRVTDAAADAGEIGRELQGGVALVGALHEAGVPVAIVSGSLRHEVQTCARELGIADRLVLAHGAEDYPHGKPHPSGYLGAATVIGVDPARCVVFEDSQVGIASGQAAGMAVVATADANRPAGAPGHQDLRAADLVVAHLGEVTVDGLRTVVAAHLARPTS